LVHRTQGHDPGDVDGIEGVSLIANSRKVDDDVGTFDSHVGFGDAAPFELVADQVADDEEIVTGRVSGRGEDDREPTLEVEAEGRRIAEAEVERKDGDDDADGRRDPRPQPAADRWCADPVVLRVLVVAGAPMIAPPLRDGAP
jgi:hypothetical protein